MKRLALLLLALMVALFFVTLDRPEGWAGWLHAFAEAGMVGAFADWFAVVALFRHPLGIPIPHTAIIPTRKDEIGDSLARFVAEHFLDPEVVRGRLASVNLARNAMVIIMVHNGTDFDFAHNIIGKTLSLVVLIILILAAFKIVPELYEDINGMFELPWRKGPKHDYLRFVGRIYKEKKDDNREETG